LRHFFCSHKILAATAFSLALLLGWLPLSYARGNLAAHLNLARGRYRILTWGLPAPWRQEEARSLRLRYGIEEHAVAGCIVSFTLRRYVEGYNQVSEAAMNRKFGHDVIEETAKEAFADWKRTTSFSKK
jgi:hypothetical protein